VRLQTQLRHDDLRSWFVVCARCRDERAACER
jgi:hypothetical protein